MRKRAGDTATGRPAAGLAAAIVASALPATLAGALPWMGASTYVLTLVYYTAYYAALGQAWNLMSGVTGYISFAHGALAGVGTYTAIIVLNSGMGLTSALVAAAAAAVVGSLAIGLPSLRLRGVAFTFATLFFQEIVGLLVSRGGTLTGGAAGLVLTEITPLRIPYVLMLAVAWLAAVGTWLLRRSVTGLKAFAISDDELAAATAGVPTTRYKLTLFCASGAVAGIVGALHALFSASVYPQVVFSVDVSLVALTLPLIGGIGTAAGPVIGALFYMGLREFLQVQAPSLHLMVLGLLIVLTVLFFPGGLVGGVRRLLEQRRREVVGHGQTP